MKAKIGDNLFAWLLAIGIFTERYIEISIITIICLLIFLLQKKLYFNRTLLCLFVSVGIISLFSIAYNEYSFARPVQQYLILFYYSICYCIIFDAMARTNNIPLIFNKYLVVANIVALIGLLQFFMYLFLGINICGFIYHTGTIPVVIPHVMRVTSILDEPGYCALLLTPAYIYYYLEKGSVKQSLYWKKWIIYIVVFLTFSAATYLILFIAVIYCGFSKKSNKMLGSKYCLLIGWIVCGSFIYYHNNTTTDNIFSEITSKIDDTISSFADMDPHSFELLNLSSYSTMTNLWVALNAPTRIIGTGIGTHPQNYELLYKSDFEYYGLNKEDGYSLFNRIYSEFGILGIGLLLLFIVKNGDRKNVINVSVLFLIITLCIRGGNYVRYGTIFFFFLYYNIHKYAKKQKTLS